MVELLLILVVVDLAIKFGREKKHYEYNPHLDPQLTWAGKKEGTSFDIDTVSVHIHERISTQAKVCSKKTRMDSNYVKYVCRTRALIILRLLSIGK